MVSPRRMMRPHRVGHAVAAGFTVQYPLTGFVAALIASFLLTACGRLNGADNPPTPTAVAEVIGYAAPNSAGDLSIDVRAQAELVLTGKGSVAGDGPIVGFLWEPVNAAAESATLTVRDSSTVAVVVPPVAQPTDMQFRLTVTDSLGNTDAALATLHVLPGLDSDRFLTYLPGAAKLRVVAATAQPAAAGEFNLGVEAQVTYRMNSGADSTITYDVETVHGTWAASSAPSTDNHQTDFRNPLYQLAIPSVDLDVITRQLQKALPTSAPQLPNPAFVDLAKLAVVLTLTPVSSTSSAALYVLDKDGNLIAQQTNSGSGQPVELTLTPQQVDDLRITGGGRENSQTAASYYQAIDPQSTKLTLRDWLTQNCFDPAAANFGADAHAVYVNNFELGFGRDMYFKTTRPASCTSSTFTPGNAAAVVINYLTLAAAAKKAGAFIAVAMEYRAVDAERSAPGLVTFYAFAPDTDTGELRRVSAANFDGRGEKYLPGTCAFCHGGRPKTPDPTDRSKTYTAATPAGADIGALFMPWDLESLLFTDTDPTFPNDAANAALRAQLTRAQQEGELKKLNAAAYGTYGSGSGAQFHCYAPFAGPCDLVEAWYGGPGLPSATFKDKQVTPGWIAGGNNPANAPDLYLNVFARYCRSCHTQRVFPTTPSSDPQFRTYSQFVQTGASAPAFGDKVIERVLHVGSMPGARMTMDRFWLPGANGGKSAGQLLAEHFGLAADTHPGTALACFSPLGATPDFSTSPTTRQNIERRDALTHDPQAAQFSAECTNLGSTFTWQLIRPGDSTATLTASDGLRTAFVPDKPGDYDLVLNVTNPVGTTSTLTKYAHVENLTPSAPSLAVTVDLNTPVPVDVLGSPGDLPTTVTIDSITGTGLAASLDAAGRIVATASSVGGGTIQYTLTDVDNTAADKSSGVITVNVGATITARAPLTPPRVEPNLNNQEIDLSDLITAQGQPVTVSISSSPHTSLVGTNIGLAPPLENRGDVTVAPCTGNAVHTCALYSPPAHTITHFGTIAVNSSDSFQYRACFTDQPTTCSEATVTVEIGGHQSFTVVVNALTTPTSTCLFGCHENPQTGASWTLPSRSSAKAAWCAIRFAAGDTDGGLYASDAGQLLVNPGNPGASLLYLKPTNVVPHGGGDTGITIRPEILAWINEGGSYTGGSDQTCP